MTPGRVVLLTLWRMEYHPEGPEVDPIGLSWVLTRWSAWWCIWVESRPGINTGWEVNTSRAGLLRRTRGCWWKRGWTWHGNVLLWPRKPDVSWTASKEVCPMRQGRWLPHSVRLLWNPTWRSVSSFGFLSTGRAEVCRTMSREGSWQCCHNALYF